ncbi:MAG: hypothetical protein WD431_11355 [Cyclobacteriaceae bacterium]
MSKPYHMDLYESYLTEFKKYQQIMWVGIALYGIGAAFASTFATGMIKLIQLFEAIGLLGFAYAIINMIQFRLKSSLLNIFLFLYLAWSVFIILHGYEYTYQSTKSIFFSGVFQYFLPIILFIPKNLNFYKNISNIIVVYCIAFVFLNILYSDLVFAHYDENVNQKFTFEGFTQNLGIVAPFVLLTYIYHDKYKNWIAFSVTAFIFAVATYKARRGVMALSFVYLMLFLLIFYIYSNRKVLVFVIFAFILFFVGMNAENIYRQASGSFLEELQRRGAEDTRSGVENAFKRDFEPVDWIIGRGINGEYWCPNVDMGNTTGYRFMIETDYLNIILKGGIIQLALMIIIALPAAFKALFYSNNLFSKVAGIWIIIWILCLYPLNVFNMDLNHILFWISVSIGYSQDLRRIPDEQIINDFKGSSSN